MQYNLDDTICAIATGEGGAIAIIRVSGPDVMEVLKRVFSKDLSAAKSHTLHYGNIHYEGKVIDEVVVSIFKAPKSYTGEHVAEISCHASKFAQTKILDLLVAEGCRIANRGEFTLRAFLNKKIDLSQAEAVADLIAAKNESQKDLAMHQMRGGFKNDISNLRQELLDFTSLLELELDFSEEDVEFADREKLIALIHKILEVIGGLIESFKYGNVVKEGIRTVIVGRPNAGKSTLLNALLKEDRAIVSNIEGTTRDTIEEVLTLDGIDYRLIDTAGIREATNEIESIGIERTYENVKNSALLVYVYDANALSIKEVEEDLDKLNRKDIKSLIIANKSDLVTKGENTSNHLKVSAKSGDVSVVFQALRDAFEAKDNSEGTIVYNSRHMNELIEVQGSLQKVVAAFENGLPTDLIAIDIHHALHHLGLLTGEVTNDEVLGNIFSNFCIGK
ncbi:MAG: tRNA uridine-5-carboxymethylaminomethyl(34) synthesis GTPase MnmE [Flavobacteriales bacterium]|nr:tRNA uridine-5-carboxymethylaminomethyl(34) synthesis GTPase MnmE [Flavobacteriales bacterium]